MRTGWIAAVGLALSMSACHQGYMRPDELDQNERGPKACAASCDDLGMKMSAFVLVERGTAGCVCTPKPAHDERQVTEPASESEPNNKTEPATTTEPGTETQSGAKTEDAADDEAAISSIGPVAAYTLILQQQAEQQRAAQQAQTHK